MQSQQQQEPEPDLSQARSSQENRSVIIAIVLITLSIFLLIGIGIAIFMSGFFTFTAFPIFISVLILLYFSLLIYIFLKKKGTGKQNAVKTAAPPVATNPQIGQLAESLVMLSFNLALTIFQLFTQISLYLRFPYTTYSPLPMLIIATPLYAALVLFMFMRLQALKRLDRKRFALAAREQPQPAPQ